MIVDTGPSGTRVAGLGPDGAPRVLELAAGTPLPVCCVPMGVAAAVAAAGRRRGAVLVLDVGHRRTEAALVRAGVVVVRRGAPGCGSLDEVVAGLLRERSPTWAGHPELIGAARRAREALSLLAAVDVRPTGSSRPVWLEATAVRAALHGPLSHLVRVAGEVGGTATPVLLVGGGARAPQLAELFDAAGFADVSVARRPDAAAVLGALAHPARPRPTAVRTPWLPAPPVRSRSPWRTGLAAVAAAVVLVALHLLGGALSAAPALPAVPALPAAPAVADDVLAQYGYRLQIPAGWAHTGGLPERRRSLLTPVAAPEGSDLIVIEATPLGYDSAAEPARAAAELRAVFDAAVAAGSPLLDYTASTQVGGRTVTAYRERSGATDVQWYVVLDSGTQLSVGCRHTPAGAAAVREACTDVVVSVDG